MMVLAVNEDQVTPGVLAFFIVAALGVTLFLLVRSMNKQIRRIEAPSEDDLRQAEWEQRQKDGEGSGREPRPGRPNAEGNADHDAGHSAEQNNAGQNNAGQNNAGQNNA
jgi:hypothetical protein